MLFLLCILFILFSNVFDFARMQDELFANAWSRNNQLLKSDPLSQGSVILGAAHIARGTTSLTDMRRNVKKFVQFYLINKFYANIDYSIIVKGIIFMLYYPLKNSSRFQNKAKFTSWSKETMKIGLCSVPPFGHPASLLCLLNSTAMSSMLYDTVKQFDKLFSRKVRF